MPRAALRVQRSSTAEVQESSQTHFRVVFRAECAVVWHCTKVVCVHNQSDHPGIYLQQQIGRRSQSGLGRLSPTSDQEHSIGFPGQKHGIGKGEAWRSVDNDVI